MAVEIKAATVELIEEYVNQFCQLYEMCFHQKMTCEEVIWRYLKNPRKEILMYIAIDEGKLVGSYCATPLNMRVGENICEAILALNTMTHPDYSNRGVFSRLAEHLYCLAKEKGYQFAYSFPNYLSNGILVSKLGWEDVYEIPTMERAIDDSLKSRLSGECYEVIQDSKFVLDYSKCFIDNNNQISINKTNEYLRWRYADSPSNQYQCFALEWNQRVSSYVVCKEYKDRLNIIDYYLSDDIEMEKLFNYCLMHGAKCAKRFVTVWAKLGEKEHLYFEKLGFKNSSPVTYLAVKNLNDFDVDLSNYKNWNVRMGDDNVY